MKKVKVAPVVPGGACPKDAFQCTLDAYHEISGVKREDIPSVAYSRDGYMLIWEDDIKTWVDTDTFNVLYRVEVDKNELFDFGKALDVLRHGGKVARLGWNGKGMFLYLVTGSTIDTRALRSAAKEALGDVVHGEAVRINGHIDMYAADGSIVVGWLASQTDMLACDWYDAGYGED